MEGESEKPLLKQFCFTIFFLNLIFNSSLIVSFFSYNSDEMGKIQIYKKIESGLKQFPTNTFYNHKNPHRKLPILKILNKPGPYILLLFTE